MCHTGGASANPPWGQFDGPVDNALAIRREIVHWLVERPRRDESIGTFNYSNLGYTILGHAIEKIRGHAWEVEIRKRLFEPLGMKSVGFGPPSKQDAEAPWGHAMLFGFSVDRYRQPSRPGARRNSARIDVGLDPLSARALDDRPHHRVRLAVDRSHATPEPRRLGHATRRCNGSSVTIRTIAEPATRHRRSRQAAGLGEVPPRVWGMLGDREFPGSPPHEHDADPHAIQEGPGH